uniref:Uncharacterized protein n=1 Tax=Odontella aurita TaxID=265563 RepID=A0A7S4JT09_9STRA|mmetsp:Transcript_52898/g.158352  ORF Transcript_52898/g.158352 Transcript_52898/m.158352 type:complete len:289 (+) Transcript_52898:89-955(+)
MPQTLYGARTLLELRVGRTAHSSNTIVDVLVQLRHADLEWWNSDLADHQSQLLKIIGRRILPAELKEEIERRSDLISRKRRRGEGGLGASARVVIGEKNMERSAAAATKAGGEVRGKRGGRGSKKFRKRIKTGEQTLAADKNDAKKKVATSKKKDVKKTANASLRGDIKYLFGDTIQITYKVEEIQTSESATLLYNADSSDDEEGSSEGRASTNMGGGRVESSAKQQKRKSNSSKSTTLASFRRLDKLPKRIVIWCFRLDPQNPTAPNPEGGGFPRPELVPMSSIFSL